MTKLIPYCFDFLPLIEMAPASTATLPFLPPTTPPSTLFLVLDIHPLSWSILSGPPPPNDLEPGTTLAKAQPTSLHLSEFLDVLMVFLNAHLASRWGNEVVVFAATAGRAYVLERTPLISDPSSTRDHQKRSSPNQTCINLSNCSTRDSRLNSKG